MRVRGEKREKPTNSTPKKNVARNNRNPRASPRATGSTPEVGRSRREAEPGRRRPSRRAKVFTASAVSTSGGFLQPARFVVWAWAYKGKRAQKQGERDPKNQKLQEGF